MLSYSFHISSKNHSINTVSDLSGADKHNNRKYENSSLDSSKNRTLVGTSNIVLDVKKVYQEEFDEALQKYNEKQKRTDRKINSYIEFISKSKKNEVATEIIIQVGDKEFWKNQSQKENDKYMIDAIMDVLYQDQIETLQTLLPDFKIANATLHLDESSPHIHVIGVPIARGYKQGLDVQVSKSKVFTQESLEMLQDKMRAAAQKSLKDYNANNYLSDIVFKKKEKGRNKDFSKDYYIQKKAEEHEKLLAENLVLQKKNADLENKINEKTSLLEKIKNETALALLVVKNSIKMFFIRVENEPEEIDAHYEYVKNRIKENVEEPIRSIGLKEFEESYEILKSKKR